MAALRQRQVIDEVDLTLLVRPLLALNVLPGACDDEYETAVRGRVPGGVEEGVGKRDGAAEVIRDEPDADSMVAVVRPRLVADSGPEQLCEAGRPGVNDVGSAEVLNGGRLQEYC